MAARLVIRGRARQGEQYLIVPGTVEEVLERFDRAYGAPVRFEPLWAHGSRGPEPIWLRRDEVIKISAAPDADDPDVHVE